MSVRKLCGSHSLLTLTLLANVIHELPVCGNAAKNSWNSFLCCGGFKAQKVGKLNWFSLIFL